MEVPNKIPVSLLHIYQKAKMTKQISVAGHVDQLESNVVFAPIKMVQLVNPLWKTPFSVFKLNTIISEAFMGGKVRQWYEFLFIMSCSFFFTSLFSTSLIQSSDHRPSPTPIPTHLILQRHFPYFWADSPC